MGKSEDEDELANLRQQTEVADESMRRARKDWVSLKQKMTRQISADIDKLDK